ncbi:MAG: hypothetical protein M1495_25020 [Bacteroidetes bacterium]|nr:hypothetical protein [Bacteroidota bacterium]MCL6099770.1 hypothetical protein [Bacteroidota bacterium]
MTTISLSDIKDLYLSNVLFELHKAKEKNLLFENKYKLSFTEFEKLVKESTKEDFSNWDDYMEWKAFVKSYQQLLQEKADLENGNIKVA